MGLSQLNFAGLNKVEVAIMRLREFEPPGGYYLAFSGGKESVVIDDLAFVSNAFIRSAICCPIYQGEYPCLSISLIKSRISSILSSALVIFPPLIVP